MLQAISRRANGTGRAVVKSGSSKTVPSLSGELSNDGGPPGPARPCSIFSTRALNQAQFSGQVSVRKALPAGSNVRRTSWPFADSAMAICWKIGPWRAAALHCS